MVAASAATVDALISESKVRQSGNIACSSDLFVSGHMSEGAAHFQGQPPSSPLAFLGNALTGLHSHVSLS